jgi:transcriptional regulator with XRE-family HTH domain
MENFGRRLKEERKDKRVTLRKISEYVGKSIGYLSDIEHDRKGPPDLETVRKIEECLGTDDGKLINLASKLRKRIPKDVTQRIRMAPKLSEALLRAADDLTDVEFDHLISYMEQIKKKRGE